MAQCSKPKTPAVASVSTSSKRNSGLFSFLKWFKSPSRESVASSLSGSPSLDSVAAAAGGSISSLNSDGTASSFCFVPPAVYGVNDKCINISLPPETDTYKARLSQLHRIRERDKNITLRQKYNLFFNRDKGDEEQVITRPENCKSLPIIKKETGDKQHRRTNSDSSNNCQTSPGVHVKGKRRAPSAPPAKKSMQKPEESAPRRKKRLAPQPPVKIDVIPSTSQNNDKSVSSPCSSKSPQPYKTEKLDKSVASPSSKRESFLFFSDSDSKQSNMKSTKTDDSKISADMLYLTNISELDRQASEIIQRAKSPNGQAKESNPTFAEFKKKPSRNIISKLNVVSNVKKIGKVPNYFTRKNASDVRNEIIEESPEPISTLLKSETSGCSSKFTIAKLTKKNPDLWVCPVCRYENVHWRIICSSCSSIKPYGECVPIDPNLKSAHHKLDPSANKQFNMPLLMRSQTQIEIPRENSAKKLNKTKANEEKEKLKQMLIEMKNSLPKKPKESSSKSKENSPKIDNSLTANELENAAAKVMENGVKSKDLNVGTEVKQNGKENENKIVEIKPSTSTNLNNKDGKFRLMRANEFEDIYTTKIASFAQHVYANTHDEKSPVVNGNCSKDDLELRNNNKDTLEVNKLIKRLENAIVKGNLSQAASYATELAQLKVNCSVTCRKIKTGDEELTDTGNKIKSVTVDLYVEDRVSHRGPIPVQVLSNQTVRELKEQIHKEFNIPVDIQRWILGKELANNNDATLADHNIIDGSPIFLYLVAATNNTKEADVNKNRSSKEPLPTTSGLSTKPSTTNSQSNIIKKEESPNKTAPQIVAEHLKVHVMIKPKVNSETQISISKTKTDDFQIKSNVASTTNGITTNNGNHLMVTSNKSIIETKTENVPKNGEILVKETKKEEKEIKSKPNAETGAIVKKIQETPVRLKRIENKTWTCHMCTVINEYTRNICMVCASVKQSHPPITKPLVKETIKKSITLNAKENKLHDELMHLDRTDLVPNTETFQCQICFLQVPPNIGVTLRDCLHQFCKECLANTVEFSEEAQVKCPYIDKDYSCDVPLQDREIKALVSKKVYEQHLAKSVTEAENKMNSFHCKTPDCHGWCVYEDNVNEFTCPLCKKTNCINCQAIHTGLNCRQYQQSLHLETDQDAKDTNEMLRDLVDKGEALFCPACNVFLMKKWGCDWVRCSMCKTEICWVTKGFRWGPTGKGDVSGGCKCGVNGVKCHPKCNYCH